MLEPHYCWLGRVSASYGMLDIQIGMLGHAAMTGESWTEDWTKVAGRPGAAVDFCSWAIDKMPDDLADRTRVLLKEVEPLRLRRHQLSHAVCILDPDGSGRGAPWLLKNPKGGESPLLDEAEGEALVRAINGLSRTAAEIRAALRPA